MKFRTGFISLFAAATFLAAPFAASRAEDKAVDDKAPQKSEKAPPAAHTVVEKGSKVAVEYTLSEDGKVVESNAGKQPLTYEQGAGNMLPAFEAQLDGLKPGAKKEFDLTPEQAYGPVRKELYQTVDAEQIPAEARKPGTMLMAKAQNGQQRQVRVHEVNGDKVVLDLNHPLAGKKLHFAVKVLSVQ
jgi:FKBP-type peptidyl-prolyl cis-trans isomerase SlyD